MPPRPPVYRPPLMRPGPHRREIKTPARSGDHARPHSRARGYDRTWERLRRIHLAENPYCRMCLDLDGVVTPARVVDHIETIEDAPEKRLDPANLQSLCDHHHNSTKQREDHARRRAARRAEREQEW